MITVTHNTELMVAGVTGDGEADIDFIDGYGLVTDPATLHVQDSGYIIIAERDIDTLVATARKRGLDVEVEKQ